MTEEQLDNPFYYNYVFSKEDMKRFTLKWHDKLKMFFYPMLVQCSEGYAIYYKIDRNGAYYIYKFEELPEVRHD